MSKAVLLKVYEAMQDQGEKEVDQFDPEADVDNHLHFVDAFDMPWWQYSLERQTFEKCVSRTVRTRRLTMPLRGGLRASPPYLARRRVERACTVIDCRSFGASSSGTNILHLPLSSLEIVSHL